MNRQTWIILAAIAVAVLVGVLLYLFARPRTGETEVTPATFSQAIANYACGDTLKLAAGTYNNPRWSTKDCPGKDGVTITSADPAARAKFVGGVLMDNARSVSFVGVDIEQTATTANSGHVFRAYAGRDLRFSDVGFRGTISSTGSKWGYGINVTGIPNLTVEKCRFRDVYMGVVAANSSNVLITNNDITDFGSDGINVSGLVDAEISYNYIGRATPVSGQHPDGLQVQQAGSSPPSQRMTIKGNLVDVPFEGPTYQGLFGGAENKVRMTAISFLDNTVLNAPYNALSFTYADQLTIRGNKILFEEHPGTGWTAWIKVDQSSGAINDNAVQAITVTNSNMSQAGNTITGFATREQVSAARDAWMTAYRKPDDGGGGQCKQCEDELATVKAENDNLKAANDNLTAENNQLQKNAEDAIAILQRQPARRR